MNIFVLSWNVLVCASWYMDKHVHKIITEIAQLLCTSVRLMHPERNAELNKNKLFKSSHVHHPITKWLLVCKPNWSWTVSMAGALHDEWKKRYNHPEDRVHKSYAMVQYLEKNPPTNFETDSEDRTPFTPCVGGKDNIIEGDVEASYKKYYMSPGKQRIASWKYCDMPDWYEPDPEHFQKAFEEQKEAREKKKLERLAKKEKGTGKGKTLKKRKSEEALENPTKSKKSKTA